jgi:MFS transporter, PAT family, beta-lactamase induction signal transducer AmpG
VEKPATKPPHPFLYLLLFLPFGATSAFIQITIGALAGKAGLSDAMIAGMTATNTLPHTWKFLWAPLVDTVWTGRGWYISTNLLSSAAIITLGFIPISEDTVWLLTIIIFVNGLSTTFVGMCTEALMAKLTPPDQRGAAGGWSQAGNLGGAVLGGVGLLIANHSGVYWLPFVVIGTLLLACSTVLSFVKEPAPVQPRPKFFDSIRVLGRDIRDLLTDPVREGKVKPKWLLGLPPVLFYTLSGAGILSLSLSLMPIGSGGAQNLFSVMGGDWGASDDWIAILNTFISGIAAVFGSLAGGWVSSKIDKRRAYALSGVILALLTFAWALSPQNIYFFTGGVIAYNFALGMCYATFTAFVLDIIGHTGGATKYNLFASLANMPIYTMALVDGWVATKHGRNMMLWIDGLAGIVGAVVLMAIVFVLRKRRLDPPPAA